MRSAILVYFLFTASAAIQPAGAVGTRGREARGDSFHFAYEISPILAKAGCAAAECHGSATGRGGFKLSLFAGDPLADYEAIRNELDGRRLDYAFPNNSLVLKKPSRKMKHGGGRVLRETDPAFQSLLQWIKDGAPLSKGEARELLDIDLTVRENRANVVATFRSGAGTEKKDVTELTVFESTNEQVAQVDGAGTIERLGPGEAWILARYGHLNARIPVREPFSDDVILGKKPEPPHPLDAIWLKRLAELGLKPARAADPFTIARRLYLDLAGRPPSPYELREFMELPSDSRVRKTVGRLVTAPEFNEVFALHLGAWFEVPAPGMDGRIDGSRNQVLRRFFKDSLAEDLSISEIARKALVEDGPNQVWKRFGDPRDRAEFVGRSMLGLSIACARCHNHPLDRWRQGEHLQFSAYFADPRPAAEGAMMAGKFFLPGEGRPVEPALLPLGRGKPPSGLTFDKTVSWFVLKRANNQFARNFANRIFGVLVGKPLVSAPDDHRISNPAIHEPLLDLLTETFHENNGNLRSLVRFIATSRLYALSSQPPNEAELTGDPASTFLARREPRPLSPGQFKTAVEFVLGVTLDRPPPPESPLARQLYIMNSGLLQDGLNRPGNQVEAVLEFQSDPERQLEDLYSLILSRQPRIEEKARLIPVLEKSNEPDTAGRDLAFALLASREFGSLR